MEITDSYHRSYCETCSHEFSKEGHEFTITYDENGHWYECACEYVQGEVEAHTMENGVCTDGCGYIRFIRGDVNNDGSVSSNDAIYLLRYTMNANKYPIVQDGDMNGDGAVSSNDAIYLLRHTMNPSRYPLS